jgi:DNA-binding NtrC family response regulator
MFSINCAAVPETLIESELFGHERGAFSGAIATKKGLFEQADGSTIFLDEIGELSPKSQAEFLRILETKRFTRVGSLRERTTDVRIIAATNRPLEQEIAAGRFRQDLYFRLNTASIPLPPLRDHPLDIPVLARHFLHRACEKEGRPPLRLGDDAVRRLALHGWPGNVRELRNLMDYVAATCPRDVVRAKDFPENVAQSIAPWFQPPAESSPPPKQSLQPPPVPRVETPSQDDFPNIYEEIEQLERTRIRQALEATEGVRVRAAALIGMPLRTFVSKMKRYGLDQIPSTRKRKAHQSSK